MAGRLTGEVTLKLKQYKCELCEYSEFYSFGDDELDIRQYLSLPEDFWKGWENDDSAGRAAFDRLKKFKTYSERILYSKDGAIASCPKSKDRNYKYKGSKLGFDGAHYLKKVGETNGTMGFIRGKWDERKLLINQANTTKVKFKLSTWSCSYCSGLTVKSFYRDDLDQMGVDNPSREAEIYQFSSRGKLGPCTRPVPGWQGYVYKNHTWVNKVKEENVNSEQLSRLMASGQFFFPNELAAVRREPGEGGKGPHRRPGEVICILLPSPQPSPPLTRGRGSEQGESARKEHTT